MLTIFATPKPFHSHNGIIQRNALKSWTLLDPDCEVILFGDEEGAAEMAREFNIRNEREVRRTEAGTKYLNFLFERAQQIASHKVLCYVNCDIMLMSSFWRAMQQVVALGRPFLMVGCRWDIDITEPWDFTRPDWEQRLQASVSQRGSKKSSWWIDYFVFSRGLYREIPPLVIGRNYWDHWLVWKARAMQVPVVDATSMVTAVHQNHDYSYLPRGSAGTSKDEQALRNYDLVGRGRQMCTMDFATLRLTPSGLRKNWFLPFAPAKQTIVPAWYRCWFAALGFTRPIRHRLGLRQRTVTVDGLRLPLNATLQGGMYSSKEYWSEVAESFADTDPHGLAPVLHPGVPSWFNSSIDRIQFRAWERALNACGCGAGTLVLDVGCGTGRWLRRYLRRGLRPVGLDLTQGMLRRIAADGLPCPILSASAQSLPFPADTFDLVSSVTVIQHIPPPGQDQALAELVRVLRPGGHLLLFELIRGQAPHIFSHTPQFWVKKLVSSGLSLVCWRGQEYLLLDRAFTRCVNSARTLAGHSVKDVLPPTSAAADKKDRPAPLAKRMFWSARRLEFTLSMWLEPLAEIACQQTWATHGIFVFKKEQERAKLVRKDLD